ncbi:MAG: MM0924 family protein [Pyrinomonadaceae bacterium]
MEKLLTGLLGKTVDVGCGTSGTFRGEVTEVKEGILYLRDENGSTTYIAVEKIASVYERADAHARPGFIGK